MLQVLKIREGWITTRETIVDSNQFSIDKMLEARMWQELIRLGTMRKRGLLDLFPTATNASCTMQGHVLWMYCFMSGEGHGNFRKRLSKLEVRTMDNKTGNNNGNKTGTRLEVMRLRRRLTLLEEEDQTPIQTSAWVRSFSITVMLLCYLIREPIGVLCRCTFSALFDLPPPL
ncbi:hypothetical protein Tco_0922936 [Tanacetum coccineum]|uniref:Uncharacterized protein n=1 Tax=Tanacetum coccineum TaxID=301880 RepID=A0ABQ5D0W7_9ASTR